LFCPFATKFFFWSLLLQTVRCCRFKNAFPNIHRPKVASKLKPIGRGFPLLIARGIELPAKMTDASRASSVPYVEPFWMRRPPRMYYRPR
jgi:hypothetical protein